MGKLSASPPFRPTTCFASESLSLEATLALTAGRSCVLRCLPSRLSTSRSTLDDPQIRLALWNTANAVRHGPSIRVRAAKEVSRL